MHMHKLGRPHVRMCVAFTDTVIPFENPTPWRRHAALCSHIQLSPPPSLPPGALRQRAEWSRAVCGDSDIHRMQWIINEHHLVHTTGEHSSNRLLRDGSLPLFLPVPRTGSHFFTVSFTYCPTLPSPIFPHKLPPHGPRLIFRSLPVRLFLYLHRSALFWPPPPLPMLLSGLFDRLFMVSLILIQ